MGEGIIKITNFMINITKWSPDTCDCVMEYSWDTEVTEDQRTHSFANAARICDFHAGETPEQAYEKVKEENPRKNKLMGRLEQFAELVESNPDGSVKLRGNLVGWRFNASRVLEVTISGLTTQKKAQAQSWADTNLGIGKVTIL